MPRYALPSHLHYALVEDALILLDTRSDLYFALDGSIRGDLATLERHGGALEDSAAGRLLDAALIEECDGAGRTAATQGAVPTDDLESRVDGPRPKLIDLIEITALVTTAMVRLRLGQLEAVLNGLGASGPATDAAAVHEAAHRFAAARRRLPWTRRCLPDSIALAWYLRRRSLNATLVIGVSIAPFAAHCWVQDETRILNDGADTVAGFTPILVLPA